MLVNYHLPNLGLSSCTLAETTVFGVKYSGKGENLISFLVLGCGLNGSARVRLTNPFLELYRLCVCVFNSPHLKIMAFLCREALQGHTGVELEHILVQLVVLQLDSRHTSKQVNTLSRRKCITGAHANVIFVTVECCFGTSTRRRWLRFPRTDRPRRCLICYAVCSCWG